MRDEPQRAYVHVQAAAIRPLRLALLCGVPKKSGDPTLGSPGT